MPPEASPSWWRDTSGAPSAKKALRTGLSKAWNILTTPIAGQEFSEEELLERPELLNSPEFIRGMHTSPLNIFGGLPGGGAELAVMLPILRGNKMLQAARLAKLKLPAGASKEAVEYLEKMKARYPRFYSHQTSVGDTLLNPMGAGQQIGGIQQGILPSTGKPGELYRSDISVNPKLMEPGAPIEPFIQALGHESRHGAQQLFRKRGTTGTGGLPFNQHMAELLQEMPYKDIPYEVAARLGGSKDLLRHLVGEEAWRRMKPEWRNIIPEVAETAPAYNVAREKSVFGPIYGQNARTTEASRVKQNELLQELYELAPKKAPRVTPKPEPITTRSGWKVNPSESARGWNPVTKLDVTPNKPFQGVQERARAAQTPPHWENLANQLEPLPADLGPQARVGPSDEFLQKQYEGYLENPELGRREMAPINRESEALAEEDMKAFLDTLRAKGIDPIKNPRLTAEMFQRWKTTPVPKTPDYPIMPQITDPRRLLTAGTPKAEEVIKLPGPQPTANTPPHLAKRMPITEEYLQDVMDLFFDPWSQSSLARSPEHKLGERMGGPAKIKSSKVEGKWRYKNRTRNAPPKK